jgi:putative nucleotidyltransferase with HDIG domain
MVDCSAPGKNMLPTSIGFVSAPLPVDGEVSLSEVISAMTFALDLTEGADPGHALRSCLLGIRLAEALSVPKEAQASLYYALLLKDVGCSNNAARMTQIVGGDDRAAKAIAKLADWTRPHRAEMRVVKGLWIHVLPGKSFVRRVVHFARIGLTQHKNNRQMIELRCERGAEIVRMLELGADAAETVRRLDEHWNGKGYPEGLKGQRIPLLSRICSVAQNLDVFAEDGPKAALTILRKRKGRWFDPDIVRMAEHLDKNGTLWVDARREDSAERTRAAVVALDPGLQMQMGSAGVDRVCEAFAGVVDAKSPFTYEHSIRVAGMAVEIAREMGMEPERVNLVRRAALLHDLGKLSVPNTILDKTSGLTKEEWAVVARHPGLTRSILERVSSFQELATVAGQHHEKLDGTGYPEGLMAAELSMESRVLVVADCYTALEEPRPYRGAVPPEEILTILAESVPQKLDAACHAALTRVVKRRFADHRATVVSQLEMAAKTA